MDQSESGAPSIVDRYRFTSMAIWALFFVAGGIGLLPFLWRVSGLTLQLALVAAASVFSVVMVFVYGRLRVVGPSRLVGDSVTFARDASVHNLRLGDLHAVQVVREKQIFWGAGVYRTPDRAALLFRPSRSMFATAYLSVGPGAEETAQSLEGGGVKVIRSR